MTASYFLKIFSFVVILMLLFAGVQYLTIANYSGKVPLTILPFQKIDPQAKYKVLFGGDSTAVGTGASNNIYSTAGWFSRDFPDASIENCSKNGLRLKGLVEILSGMKDKHYDLIVLQIGANDIIYLTSLKDIEEREHAVLKLAKGMADKVVILHSGDIGEVRMFYWPLTALYTWRTLKVRDIYRKSQDDRVAYVDIYELEKPVKNLPGIYAPDHLHLSDKGYHNWYNFIKTKLVDKQ